MFNIGGTLCIGGFVLNERWGHIWRGKRSKESKKKRKKGVISWIGRTYCRTLIFFNGRKEKKGLTAVAK